MKKLLLAAALLSGSLSSFAQQLQTLYYPNGNRLIQGRWRYVKSSFGNIGEVRSNESNTYTALVRLANQYERSDMYDFRQLNLRCDGPVTVWAEDGKPRVKVTFADGLERGPFTAYFNNGNTALEGWLEDGMSQGLWKAYYFKGGLHFTATYQPYTQAELDKNCAAILRYNYRATVEDNLDTMSNDAARFTYSLRHAFENIIPVQTSSLKNGDFVYYNEDGSREAKMSFKNNLRDGVWAKRSTATMPAVDIEYAAGRLVYITDSAGRHSLQTYTTLKKREWERWAKAHGEGVGVAEAPPVERIFQFVEQQAQFPGNVQLYLRGKIKYPHHIKDYMDSHATIQFFVEEDGAVSEVILTKSAHPELDEELLRVVRSMPRWSPGRFNGHTVRTGFTLNFSFGMQAELSALK